MNLNKIKYRILIFNLSLLIITGAVQAEEVISLKAQIQEFLNLETEIMIEKSEYGSDKVVLWVEPMEDGKGYAKNWGLVLFSGDKPVDAWFYAGPLTNSFKDFYLSFHQFTWDGRKELAVVGADPARNGWAYIFIFNLTDRGLELLYKRETNSCGGSYFVKEDEIFNQGMFLDLDLDQIEELFVYREVKGSLSTGPYWVDIYTWDGKKFVLSNKKYPELYIPFFEAFKRAAQEEEKLPMGKHKIFYEYIAKIYEIWDEPKGAQDARELAILPPMEMGKTIKKILKEKGFRAYRVFRVDLDGSFPKDAIIWGKGIEGLRNRVWIISQKNEIVSEPLQIPLLPSFFQNDGEIFFTVENSQIQISRKPTDSKPGLTYLYSYSGDKLTLIGREETYLLANGQVVRRIAGQVLKKPKLGSEKEIIIKMPLFKAVQTRSPLRVDGMFSEKVWSLVETVAIEKKEQIIEGADQWGGKADLSYTIGFAYCYNSLYLSIKVKDENRIYAQESGINPKQTSDHIEIWFRDDEKVYRYGIFILPMKTLIMEWDGEELKEPTHTIHAQWMPSRDGYWMEVKIGELDLSDEIYPMTVAVWDIDDPGHPEEYSLMATSPLAVEDLYTLGIIKLH
ncbi:hypothetical protein BBF96_04195 [Anoxybacter fermentans]|uniref:Carbohydrate-binding domain-containing protein n=1 Tax=Anoxybacter fermentans TaxID=1323375 RepID=A0A3Q9HPC7_9FIRM|nr:hypothetical protein [Anoxybacter fermentans]AZR72658.1 hypothetical protein BBF96_04195 [Anoxybacter fermentans]